MSESLSRWRGNRQCGQSFQLRTCPICRREAQHLVGLRFSQIHLLIFMHYDENSEVDAVHVHSAYRRTLHPFAYPQENEWSDWTR